MKKDKKRVSCRSFIWKFSEQFSACVAVNLTTCGKFFYLKRGKKSFSHRRKKARAQTSSSVSSETSCSVIANPSKQHNHRNHLISSVSSPSTSRFSVRFSTVLVPLQFFHGVYFRSLSVGKRSTQIGFVTSADLPPEGV